MPSTTLAALFGGDHYEEGARVEALIHVERPRGRNTLLGPATTALDHTSSLDLPRQRRD